MISTITTSTMTMASDYSLFGTLGLIGMAVLASLLIQQELCGASRNVHLLRFRRILRIAIAPLLLVFTLQVAFRVVTELVG